MKTFKILLPALMLLAASCASKKDLTRDAVSGASQKATSGKTSPELQRLAFAQKVYDNQVYAKNITGNMTFTLKSGDKEVSAPGALRMRKDAVVRLQLFVPLLGSEVGRIDFTPDKVLIVDRLHKEYIEAGYDEVDFLQENGISFYTLQSLFWNQLFIPGQQSAGESDLKKFSMDTSSAASVIPLSVSRGKMRCAWNADKATGQIQESVITYESGSHGTSTLNWKYADFTAVGTKMFPKTQTFRFSSPASGKQQTATVSIEMNGVKTDSDWDTATKVSSKYKKVDAATILKKLIKQ